MKPCFILQAMVMIFALLLNSAAARDMVPVLVPVPQQKPRPHSTTTGNSANNSASNPATLPQAQKPPRRYQAACLAVLQNQVSGQIIAPIDQGQCRITSPLQLTALNQPVTMQFDQAIITNCTMATTLLAWAKQADRLARLHFGSTIKTIGTGSHYQCRAVNNQQGSRRSEHSFANALDIMSFTFSNGETTHLADGWNSGDKQQQFWRQLHHASCSLFMTVLGPQADEAHQTNLHLDMGCHGQSCTSRICQ